MNFAKVRLPKSPDASRAMFEVARKHRLVGVREEGEILYQIPMTALEVLDEMGIPYELLESDLPAPVSPSGVA